MNRSRIVALIIIAAIVATFAWQIAHSQGATLPWNPGTAIGNPANVGSSLYPQLVQGVGGLSGTFAANSTTFTCNSGCSSIVLNQWLNGTDSGAQQIWPAQGGQLGVMVLSFSTGGTCTNGCTVTTQIPTNAALTPGTYNFQVGLTRWNTTSTLLANTIGVKNLWVGDATLGSNTWMNQYLSGDCDNPAKATTCFLGIAGNTRNVTIGSRTSDSAVYGQEILLVNDDAITPHSAWGSYWQTELMAGVGSGKITHALESTTFNFNSSTARPDPYLFNISQSIENLRLSSGQPSQLYQMYPAADAISILGIAPDVGTGGFMTGIVFGSTALDTSGLTHPPALSLPANANGYSLSWYKASGYTTPAWQVYSDSTTQNGNTMALQDADVLITIFNSIGQGTVTLGSGSIALANNHLATFSTTGNAFDIAAQTIKDTTASGTVTNSYATHLGRPTYTTTNAGVTVTNANTFTIDNCPAAGTNVTITNCFAMRVLAGTSRFDGNITGNAGMTILQGGIILNNQATADTTAINTGSNTGGITIGNSAGGALNLAAANINIAGVKYASATVPTINSHFNTSSDSITAVSTASFRVTVGTGAATNTGSLTFPAATTGWSCKVTDATTNASFIVEAFSTSTTAVTVNNYSRTTGAATNFTNSEKLEFLCGAY